MVFIGNQSMVSVKSRDAYRLRFNKIVRFSSLIGNGPDKFGNDREEHEDGAKDRRDRQQLHQVVPRLQGPGHQNRRPSAGQPGTAETFHKAGSQDEQNSAQTNRVFRETD